MMMMMMMMTSWAEDVERMLACGCVCLSSMYQPSHTHSLSPLTWIFSMVIDFLGVSSPWTGRM